MTRRIFGAIALAFAATVPAGAQQPEGEYILPEPMPEHAALKKDVGTWDATVKLYMAGPDTPPETTDAVETNTMLGDFWLLSTFEMDFGGTPYTGHGQIGFDPDAEQYVMTWTDSMSPRMMTMRGKFDESSKTLTMTGKGYEESLGKEIEHRSVSRNVDDETRLFTMSMKAPEFGDDWITLMEVEYHRRDSAEK